MYWYHSLILFPKSIKKCWLYDIWSLIRSTKHSQLCLKVLILAPERRQPRISEAWFSSSLRIKQPCKKEKKKKLVNHQSSYMPDRLIILISLSSVADGGQGTKSICVIYSPKAICHQHWRATGFIMQLCFKTLRKMLFIYGSYHFSLWKKISDYAWFPIRVD